MKPLALIFCVGAGIFAIAGIGTLFDPQPTTQPVAAPAPTVLDSDQINHICGPAMMKQIDAAVTHDYLLTRNLKWHYWAIKGQTMKIDLVYAWGDRTKFLTARCTATTNGAVLQPLEDRAPD